jgi:Lon protease-like protein
MEMLPLARVVLPGTRHSVPSPTMGLKAGARVVVVLTQPDGRLSRVGTTSRIEGVAPGGDDWVLLDLVGEWLVSIESADGLTSVEKVDPAPLPSRQDLVPAAQAALRRYMAVRAEAGHGGDIHVAIEPDPVIASHQVASHLEISWPEVQDILEAGDANDRLEREILVLDRETALLRAVLGRSE